ncbi:MAG: OB-fold nucleic acid binding domain-containing protein [Methanolinea sp.]|nr:OB-fold nucleic acid binding domain-containing protein [Methanolinea sp.]
MHFHYALVDDLISREEFERRVEEKMAACGDLIDEVTAAMMVVRDLGRHHVKIAQLNGRQSLFSFFGKVIAKDPVREFERPGGEKGLVSSLVLGDETGQVRAILWDEKAAATEEIDVGDVLEVIGRHTGRSPREITVMAMRPAPVEISGPSEVAPYLSPPRRKDIVVWIIAMGEAREVARRDGTAAGMVEMVVSDGKAVTRMACWVPEHLDILAEGACFRIRGALEKHRRTGPEYSIDEKSSVEPAEGEIAWALDPLDGIGGKETCSVRGLVRSCSLPRPFVTREGKPSSVRNIAISDGTAEVRAVLWGDHAHVPLVAGDEVGLYLCSVRPAKDGGHEIHAGRGSFVRVASPPIAGEVDVRGDVIVAGSATYLDTGDDCFLVVDGRIPHGHPVRARVIRAGNRVSVVEWEEDVPDRDALLARCEGLLAALQGGESPGGDTFTPHGREDICR